MGKKGYIGIGEVSNTRLRVGSYVYCGVSLLILLLGVFVFGLGFCYMMTGMQNVGTTSFTELLKLWCKDGIAFFDMPIFGEVPRYLALMVVGMSALIGGIVLVSSFYSALDNMFEVQTGLAHYKSSDCAYVEAV